MNRERYKTIVDSSLLAGKIMLENGAETSRVEDTMERIICKAMGEPYCSSSYTYVTVNGIFVTIGQDNTNFVRIDTRDQNLEKVTRVNQISRSFASDELTIEDVYTELQIVDKEPMDYSLAFKIICTSILSGSVMFIMGGKPVDLPATMIAGVICYVTYLLGLKFLKTPFIVEYVAAFVGGMAALFINNWFGSHLSSVMIGTVAPLVPGIAITNAIRDIMAKHYISGSIRGLEAIFIAGAIGTGIATVYYLFF